MNERIAAEVFPPGDYIREELAERGWTQSDLADVLGRPLQLVSDIILDKRGITPETAKGLAEAFETSAQLWLNLDAAWQLYKSRNSVPDPAIAQRARIYSKAPVREIVKRGWIEYSSNPQVLEQRVLNFLGMKHIDDVPDVLPVAARMATTYEAWNPGQWAWVRRARKLGETMQVEKRFDPKSDAVLVKVRNLLAHPEEIRHLPRVLAEEGIRFIILKHLDKTRIDGACLWLDDRSPIIALSLRYDRIDHFWFCLMHELGHALKGDGLKDGLLTLDISLVGDRRDDDEDLPALEIEANRFAEEALIPRAELDDFVMRQGPFFSEVSVRGFAAIQRVHPGLVVGQIQHREGDYRKLRSLLVRVRELIVNSALTDGWGHSVPSLT